MRKAMIYLQKYGISLALCAKIYEYYGQKVYRVLEENPYQIADRIPGVGFRTADELARRIGICVDSDYRIQSGIVYALLQATTKTITRFMKLTLMKWVLKKVARLQF